MLPLLVATVEADAPAVHAGEETRMTSTVLRLAGPVVIERLSVSILSAVDAFLIGYYVGADGVAAIGVSFLLFWIPLAGAFGIDIAATAVIARDFGSGRTEGMERTMSLTLLAAFIWGVLATAFLWLLAPALLTMMAAEPEVKDFGVDYIRAACLGLPLLMVLYASSGVMRGLGNTVVPMAVVIILNVVNAIVAFLLISGVAGVELELQGAGIAYACGSIVGGVLAIGVLMRGIGPVRYRFSQALAGRREEATRLLNIGLPVGLEEVQFMLAFIVYTRIVSGLGTTALAAHTIALRTLELALVPGFAIGAAATSLVSRYLGAKRPDLARLAARESGLWAIGSMCVFAVLLFIFAPQFVGLFVNDQDVIDTGARLLRVFAVAFPFLGIYGSFGGVLRGAGDAKFVMVTMMATAWLVRIPAAFFFAVVLGFGAPGAWAGAAIENLLRGSLIYRRYAQGAWTEREV
jgi:putative MATE family efflux protein